MIIKISPHKKRGTLLKKVKNLQEDISFKGALLLTGANGAGKTVLLNALAAAAGLGNRYESSDTPHSRFDMEDALSNGKGAALMVDGAPAVFDLVLRYRGDDTRKSPMALDSMEDVMSVLRQRGSHGEVATSSLGRIISQADQYVDKGEGRLLLVLDEPETAAGPDFLWVITKAVLSLCERAGNNFVVLVATQSPLIVFGCEKGGAQRMDLGGWVEDLDPFPLLSAGLGAAYRIYGNKVREKQSIEKE